VTTTSPTETPPRVGPVSSRLYGAAMILAPLMLLTGAVCYLAFEEGVNEGIVGGTVTTWALFALTLGFVGFARLLEPQAPRGSVALMVLAVFGTVAGALFQGAAIHQGYFGHYTDYVNTVFEEGGNYFGLLAYIPWGWCMPAAFVLGGVLAWRTRVVPHWSAGALAVGGVLFLLGVPLQIGPIVITCFVLLTVGLVPVGLAIRAADARAGGEREGRD
jgi:hypothetical protein